MLFRSPSSAQVVWQVVVRYAMEACHPLFKPAVISINILHMISAIDALVLAEVDGFMADPFGITERRVGGIAIVDQQGIRSQCRLEGGGHW
jgi:hypothetical protein